MGTDTPSCRFLQISLSLPGLPCLVVAVPWILCVCKSLYLPPSLSLGFQLHSPPPRDICVVPSIPTRGAVTSFSWRQHNRTTAQHRYPLNPATRHRPLGNLSSSSLPGRVLSSHVFLVLEQGHLSSNGFPLLLCQLPVLHTSAGLSLATPSASSASQKLVEELQSRTPISSRLEAAPSTNRAWESPRPSQVGEDVL